MHCGPEQKETTQTPPKAASGTQQSCLLPKIDLAADVFKLTNIFIYKKTTPTKTKSTKKTTELPLSKHANTRTVQSQRRRRECVGFARARQGGADGGCSRRRRAEQLSQLKGSAKERRPVDSSSGRTLTPNVRNVKYSGTPVVDTAP